MSCTSVNVAAHTHLYFGIRNNLNVNGNTMTGTAPAAGSAAVFSTASSTSSSITYTSTTTIADQFNGTQPVNNQLVLALTAGTGSVVATAGSPASNNFGDIERLFLVTSGSFSIRVDVKASDPFFALGQACPAVYDPTHTPASGSADISKVDLAFYYSDCGDGQIDSPEQCDLGAGNGASGTCCASNCTVPAERSDLSRWRRSAVRHERGVHGRRSNLPARRCPHQRWQRLPDGVGRHLRSK